MQTPAPPHVQGHWEQPDGLMAFCPTPCPELEQSKCQAELGRDELLPCREEAHVCAAWAARAPGPSDACSGSPRLRARLPRPSAAHKPAAVWHRPCSGDPANLQPGERSACTQLSSLGTTAAKTGKTPNFSLYP